MAEYPHIKEGFQPVLSGLSAEIKNILKFHSEHSDKVPGRIILAGGSAKLKNFPEILASQLSELNIKVETGDPRQNFSLDKNSPLNANEALSYITAMGLALRGRNNEIN